MEMIEASHLSKVYWDGDRKLSILTDVSFSVAAGEAVAILGPSGSGKTTLLNLLSGLDRPTEGRVRLDGVELGALGEKEKAFWINRNLGFVFQFYHLLPEFTAIENVMLPAWIGGATRAKDRALERAGILLRRVGLSERASHFPGELSGGEQQRVAIARALMNDPKILFCDEPTGNLDPKMAAGVAELLRKLFQEEKKTLVMVTHDDKIAGIADRVWDLVTRQWFERRTSES